MFLHRHSWVIGEVDAKFEHLLNIDSIDLFKDEINFCLEVIVDLFLLLQGFHTLRLLTNNNINN